MTEEKQETSHQSSESAPTEPRQFQSEDLLQGRQEITIRHGAEIYRLRLTRNGKLILHK